jgi:hypothetical protein
MHDQLRGGGLEVTVTLFRRPAIVLGLILLLAAVPLLAQPACIGLFAPSEAEGEVRETLDGIALGREEAERTFALMGREVRFEPGNEQDRCAIVIVAGGAFPQSTGVVIDARCGGETAGGAFRLCPPGAGDRLLWRGDLTRYGAAQLNDRYRRRFGGEMTAAAWAGWLAVKIAAETLLRSDGQPPEEVLGDLEFDGHKGEPLRFDAGTRELLQPLYEAGGNGG